MTVSYHALQRACERFGFPPERAKPKLRKVIRHGVCRPARDGARSFTLAGITCIVRNGCVLTVRRSR